MSRKSSGFRVRSRQAQAKKLQSKATLKENQKQEMRRSRRAILLLGAVIMSVFTVGALASWRGLSAVSLMSSSNSLSINSSAAVPMPSPPTLPGNAPGKEFVYAGSALLATTEPFREPPADLAVWRPSNGFWYIINAQGQWTSYQFGAGNTDTPVPADYDGDGKTDFCVFRNNTGNNTWDIYIIRSSDSSFYATNFGASTDIPAPADFDGDGKADITVWRPSNGNWYITRSSNNTLLTLQYGASGDKPVPADFDGDGIADVAVWRNSAATFYGIKSSDNQAIGYAIGQTGDVPVVGDYDGDGKADYAVRRTSNNTWWIYRSATNSLYNETWGDSTDIEVVGDYDHDGKTDIAVWRPSNGVWYIKRSSDGTTDARQWGQMGDIPVPAPYRT